MNNIASFLVKFKTLFKGDDEIKEKIQLIIKNNTGLLIEKNNLLIKDKILSLKEKPHIKNEIFMRKEKILNDLKGVILDIR